MEAASLEPAAPVQLLLHSDDYGTLLAAIDEWQRSLYSPNTRRAYLRAVRRMLDEYGQINAATLAELRDDMRDDGRKPGTIEQAMIGVVSCVRWMVAGGFAPAHTLVQLEAVPRPTNRDQRRPDAPSADEVDALVRLGPARAYPEDPVRQAHAAALLTLVARTGVRAAEAAAVNVVDLRDARPSRRLLAAIEGRPATKAAAVLQIIDGKGGVSRTLPAPEEVLTAVRRLWRALGLEPAPGDPLLPALDRARGESRAVVPLQPMTTRTIARVVEHVGAALGMDRRLCHPHALRHAYAFAQLNPRLRPDGQPLSLGVLKDRLGHRRLETTARYLSAGQDPDLP